MMEKHPFLNYSIDDLIAFGREQSSAYKSNPPFPNIYFDNFFNADYLREIVAELPDLGGGGDGLCIPF